MVVNKNIKILLSIVYCLCMNNRNFCAYATLEAAEEVSLPRIQYKAPRLLAGDQSPFLERSPGPESRRSSMLDTPKTETFETVPSKRSSIKSLSPIPLHHYKIKQEYPDFSPGNSPEEHRYPKILEPLAKKLEESVDVLQQRADVAWKKRGINLEQEGTGTVQEHPELLWKNIRQAERTNSGYHALKNTQIMMAALHDPYAQDVSAEVKDPSSVFGKALNDLDTLLYHMPTWATQVYEERKAQIAKHLSRKRLVMPEHDADLKHIRHHLPQAVRSYVDADDGHIAVDNLSASELNRLIEHTSDLKQHALAIEYAPHTPLSAQLTDPMKKQIETFKKDPNGHLAILWNEPGFNHWVSYVVEKKEGKLTIYELNSVAGKEPVHAAQLFALLRTK
jgi:hypothetical protein